MSLFQPRTPDRYDGIVTVTFKNGKLDKVKPNRNTPDKELVPFVDSLIHSIAEVYPDSGSDGLDNVAEQYFVPSSIPIFLKALKTAGIRSDMDASMYGMGYEAVVSIVRILLKLVES